MLPFLLFLDGVRELEGKKVILHISCYPDPAGPECYEVFAFREVDVRLQANFLMHMIYVTVLLVHG